MCSLQDDMIKIEQRWIDRFQVFEDMLDFEGNIMNGKKHLDFGCGYGAFAKMLAEKYPGIQVYGVDIDNEKIRMGKSRYGLPNLHLKHSERIIGKYDSITSLRALHETENAKQTLNDLFEHLKKGGTIMIHEFRRIGKARYREWFEKGKPGRIFEEEYQKHNKWSVKDFGRMCEDTGLKTQSLKPVGATWLCYIGKK